MIISDQSRDDDDDEHNQAVTVGDVCEADKDKLIVWRWFPKQQRTNATNDKYM